jgi:hypothetical protein
MNLLEAWANCCLDPTPPFLLDADRPIFELEAYATVTHSSWEEALGTPDFGAPGDKRLHLGLLPMPFLGDLRNASIYLLMLNPGLGPYDYYAEWKVFDYRRALIATLKQGVRTDRVPFIFLEPQFGWHGGFRYWHDKLKGVIQRLADQIWGVPFAEARRCLAAEIACVQLFPYRSVRFTATGAWRDLESVRLARSFVAREVFERRVENGDAIAIAMRGVGEWNLPEHPRVIRYSNVEARAARLTPDTPGGKAILEHLSERRPTNGCSGRGLARMEPRR